LRDARRNAHRVVVVLTVTDRAGRGPQLTWGEDIIATVRLFAKNGPCGGTGGVFRFDRKDVIDFVPAYLR